MIFLIERRKAFYAAESNFILKFYIRLPVYASSVGTYFPTTK